MGASFSEDLINIITTISFTVIGLVGNSLVLYVFSRKEFREKAMFRYLIAATIFDILNLLLLWFYNYPEQFKMNTYSFNCKIIVYLVNFAYSTNPWFILLSTFDRFLHVYYPHKFKFRNRLNFQLTQIALIIILMLIINLPFYFYFDLSGSLNETSCGYVENIEMIGFIAVLLPFILMILSTVLIANKLIGKKIDQTNRIKHKNEKQFIKILISMDLFFLICNLPSCIYILTSDLMSINYFGTFTYILVNDLTLVYNSFSFFVYFFCNKLFKRYFLSMLSFNRFNRINVIHNTSQLHAVQTTGL